MTSNLTDDMAYHAKGQRTFVLVMLVSCLVLQRVGLPAGADAVVSIAAPVGGMLAIWYIWTGVLSFDRKRVGIMLGLVGVALISVNLHRNVPIAMVTRNSAFSLFFWLCLTAFGTLRFTKPMDERVFFAILIRCLAFIAISGIAQFFAQFVGIKVFSFGGLLPAHFPMERFYNVEIPFGTRQSPRRTASSCRAIDVLAIHGARADLRMVGAAANMVYRPVPVRAVLLRIGNRLANRRSLPGLFSPGDGRAGPQGCVHFRRRHHDCVRRGQLRLSGNHRQPGRRTDEFGVREPAAMLDLSPLFWF